MKSPASAAAPRNMRSRGERSRSARTIPTSIAEATIQSIVIATLPIWLAPAETIPTARRNVSNHPASGTPEKSGARSNGKTPRCTLRYAYQRASGRAHATSAVSRRRMSCCRRCRRSSTISQPKSPAGREPDARRSHRPTEPQEETRRRKRDPDRLAGQGRHREHQSWTHGDQQTPPR